MSFIRKAQEAAEQARARAQEAATAAGRTASDPATSDMLSKNARDALGMARRGMTTVIEKIDPGTLADLIIRATALQEMTNKSLRAKGSPYRIAEISISASIPPAVSFSIGRLDDEPEAIGSDTVTSSELLEHGLERGDLVLALDGTTVDGAVTGEPSMEAGPGAMPPSSIERD